MVGRSRGVFVLLFQALDYLVLRASSFLSFSIGHAGPSMRSAESWKQRIDSQSPVRQLRPVVSQLITM
jgi:hypothetical protein